MLGRPIISQPAMGFVKRAKARPPIPGVVPSTHGAAVISTGSAAINHLTGARAMDCCAAQRPHSVVLCLQEAAFRSAQSCSWVRDCALSLPLHSTDCSLNFTPEEDRHTSYAQTLLKYFLAEGVATKHAVFLASADDSPTAFIKVRR